MYSYYSQIVLWCIFMQMSRNFSAGMLLGLSLTVFEDGLILYLTDT